MKNKTPIRPLHPGDLLKAKAIIDACGLFPSDMLDAMVAGYFSGADPREYWLAYDEGQPMAIAYCAPERMTQGTWNLLLIAVQPEQQGKGIGAAIMHHIERLLAAAGERLLLVETSGLPDYERTRQFYRKLGYVEEARIREFYQAGEDKIIFRKALVSD